MRTDIKTPWKSWKIKLRISPQKRKSIKTEMESKSRKETYSTNPEVVKVKKKKKLEFQAKISGKQRGGNPTQEIPQNKGIYISSLKELSMCQTQWMEMFLCQITEEMSDSWDTEDITRKKNSHRWKSKN